MREHEKIFENKILSSIIDPSSKLNKNQKLTGFLSRKGSCYNHELMVVGRAVNGWIPPEKACSPTALCDSVKLQSFIHAIKFIDDQDQCQMKWVIDLWSSISKSDYKTARSAFWRVIKNLSFQLQIQGLTDDNWSSHLVWSNLYKVSPSVSGNPGNNLCKVQLEGCIELLKQELQDYEPKVLVFLTGWNWARDFFINVDESVVQKNNKYVHIVGRFNNKQKTKVVVACHPQGKNEENWVNAVLESLTFIESSQNITVFNFRQEK